MELFITKNSLLEVSKEWENGNESKKQLLKRLGKKDKINLLEVYKLFMPHSISTLLYLNKEYGVRARFLCTDPSFTLQINENKDDCYPITYSSINHEESMKNSDKLLKEAIKSVYGT